MSAIATMYANAVLSGKRTIESVPLAWRDEVKETLNIDDEETQPPEDEASCDELGNDEETSE